MDEHPIPDEWLIPDDLGRPSPRCSPNTKTPTATAAAAPASPTGSAWRPSSSSYAPAASGRRWTPPASAPARRPSSFQEWVEAGVFLDPVGARPDGLRRLEGDRLGLAEYGRLHDQGAPRGGKNGKNPTDRAKRARKQPAGRARASRWAWRWEAPTGRT